MKLHDPVFEKSLRRRVRQVVKADPELKKESRRSRLRSKSEWSSGFFRILISFLLASFVWHTVQVTHEAEAGLIVINLWILTSVLGFAQKLVHLPFGSNDITALRFLPVAERFIFQWELDKLWKGSLFYLSDLAAGLGALAYIYHFSPLGWAAMLVLVPVSGACLLALAVLGAAWLPRLRYGLGFALAYVLWFASVISAKFTGPWVMETIDRASPFFNLLLPTGWSLSLFHLILQDDRWWVGLFVLPIGFVLWGAWKSLPVLSTRFDYQELLVMEAPDLVPGDESVAEEFADASPQMVRRYLGPTAITEGILSGQFLARMEWTHGWLEQRLWRWFNPREKTLAEFVFPSGLAITKSWKWIARNFVVAAGVGVGACLVSPQLGPWILTVGLLFVFLPALGMTANTGAAFGTMMNGGMLIPVYAAYPIGYRELSRVLLKVSAIQMPFFTLQAMASMLVLMRITGLSATLSLSAGFQVGFLFLGARFFLLVFNFSSGTNDSARFRLRSIALLFFFAIFGLSFLALVAFTGVLLIAGANSGILAGLEILVWGGSLLAVLNGYIFFRIYGWFYHANRFDLMRQPPAT